MSAHRSVEVGVTESKDAAVRRYFPVTTTAGGGGDGHKVVELDADPRDRAKKAGVAERVNASVIPCSPITPTIVGGGHAHNGHPLNCSGDCLP